MTASGNAKVNKISGMLFLLLTFFVFAALLLSPDIAIGYARAGLGLCTKTVIPSLFPFMVLSSLMVELGAPELLAKLFGVPMRFLFGISGEGAAAPLMGAFCGFPVGAMTAKKLYDSNRINGEELSRLLTFSNNPSSAFLISAVGSALWSCPRFGVVLYIIQLLSALIIGISLRILFPLKHRTGETISLNKKSFGIRTFSLAVSESAMSMLNVCALVLFFSSFVGAVGAVAESFGASELIKTLIYGFFEMTGGCSAAAKLMPVETGLVLTSLICGWSGLSVHFQVISISFVNNISFLPYFISKLFQGIISALMMLFYIKNVDMSLPSLCIPAFSGTVPTNENTAFAIIANAVFICAVILYFKANSVHAHRR